MARKERNKDLLETRKNARLVEGQVLWPNLIKPIGMAVVGFVTATILLIIAGFFISTFGEVGLLMSARMIAYAILLVIYAIAGIGILIYLLIRMRRMIIGEDRLLLLGDVGRIIGQLPYNNIVDIQLRGDHVTILLDKARRKDTWWPSMADSSEDYDVKLTAGFETDATALRLYLKDAVLAYHQRYGGPKWLS